MVKFKRLDGEEIKPVKGMSAPELITLKQKLGYDMTQENEQRRRPRNPTEWKYLKKWEHERGGMKIGEIGPPPPGMEGFDPETWDPEKDEDIMKQDREFKDALNKGMTQYQDALDNLKDK